MNLNKLRDKAYQCAVAHGWHEENLSDVHIPADTRSAFPVISVQSPVSIQCCWQS